MSEHPSDTPPPESGRDRRREERLAAAVVTIVVVRGEERSALLRDLSVTGAMFLTRARLSPGEHVKLSVFTNPDLTDPLELEGEVMRASAWEDGGAYWPFSVGVHFSAPATEHLDRIREIGQRQAAMGIVPGRPGSIAPGRPGPGDRR